jgi:hypothetical protein
MSMAKAEGWSTKNGSKWNNMPELMLMYRAAAFLIRTYAPEISMGLQTADELEDVAVNVPPTAVPPLRFTAAQMAQAKAEVAQGVTTWEVIAERYPNLHADQLSEIKTYPTPVAA